MVLAEGSGSRSSPRPKRAATARIAAYLDCPSHPDVLIGVTAGHLAPEYTEGTFDGRPVNRLASIHPQKEASADLAFEVVVLQRSGLVRNHKLGAVDVGAFEMSRMADDVLHPLPCSETQAERELAASVVVGPVPVPAAVPIVDGKTRTVLSFWDGSAWQRAIAYSMYEQVRAQGVIDITLVAEVVKGTPHTAVQVGDSGTPFFDADGHLHSFLCAFWPQELGQSTVVLLVPAKAALAQLRKLPRLQDHDIRGFLSPGTVSDRRKAIGEASEKAGPAEFAVPHGMLRVLAERAWRYFFDRGQDTGSGVEEAEELQPLQGGEEKKTR